MLTLALLAFAQSATHSPELNFVNPHQDAVVQGEKAYIMLKPKFVQPVHVDDLRWSPDGKYLMILPHVERYAPQIDDPDANRTLLLYDRSANKCVAFPGGHVETGYFVGDVLLVTTWTEEKLENGRIRGYMVVFRWAPSAMPTPMYRFQHDLDSGAYTEVQAAEGVPYAFIEEHGSAPRRYLVTPGASALIPLSTPDPRMRIVVDAKKIPYFGNFAKGGHFNASYQINPNSGEITPSDVVLSLKDLAESEALPLQLDSLKHKVSRGTGSAVVPGTWLTSVQPKPQSALVAVEATQAAVSPTLDAVAYEESGVVFIRPIEAMPLDEYADFVKRYDRSAALNRARQVGHAALMFCTDHDDHFPTAEEFSQVVNYLGDPDILEGFHYSLNGQFAPDLADPSHTVLGYIQLDGYQAVVYADSSCRGVPIK